MSSSRTALLAAAAIAAVFSSQFVWVRSTNFGGWDEWLVIDLTSRGIVGLPYQNRPFSLAFGLLGSVLSPHGLWGFYAVHAFCTAASGFLVYLITLRVSPGQERLALLAGILGSLWAPLDDTRLDVVLTASYTGVTFGSLLTLFLLIESYRRRSVPVLLAVALLGGLVARCVEATALLLAAAPLLLLAVPAVERRDWKRWSFVWSLAVGTAGVIAAWPVLFPPAGGSYQTHGLGFDPHPVRVAVRVARQFAFHLLPLAPPDWRSLALPAVGASVAVFLGVSWLFGRLRGAEPRSVPLRLGLVGAFGAALGYAVLALSPAITTPSRAQILSAPGIGLLLAFVISWVGTRLRMQAILVPVLGAWVVGVGTARVLALQRGWDERGYWPTQRQLLASVVEQAPDLVPGTFVVLLDGERVFPASFTFHHALDYLYEGRARGTSWGAEPFLYPCTFVREGLMLLPAESIRGPWQEPPRIYAYDQIVLMKAEPMGRVTVLDEWQEGAGLPPLPPGARYEPRRRILGTPRRPPLRILGSPRLG